MKHPYQLGGLWRQAWLLLLALAIPRAQAQTATTIYYTLGSSTATLDALASAPAAGGTSTSLASGSANFSQPTDVVLDKANNYLYMADQYVGTGGIYRYTTGGTGRTLVVAGRPNTTYNGLAFDAAANKLYFTQAGASAASAALKVVSLGGTLPATATSVATLPTTFTRPGDLALDATAGSLYVADQHTAGSIIKVIISSGAVTTPVAGVANATYNGLALDATNGRLYFTQGSTDPTLDALKLLTLSTSAVTTLASGSANFSQPSDLAFEPGAAGSAGQLYLADQYVATGPLLRYTLSASSGVVSASGRTALVAATAGAAYSGLVLSLSATPTVTTAAATGTTTTSAVLGGNVTADGGASVTERGVVYVAGTGTPTTSNTKALVATSGIVIGMAFSGTVSGLTAGTQYTVRAYATNSVGTSYGNAFSFTTAAPVSGTTVKTNVSCNGGSNGTINLTPSGGVAPYTFLWSPGGQTTEDRTGLAAGTYTVTITDATNATGTVSATITQPNQLAISGTQTNVTTSGGTNGSATVTVSGGAGSYTYSWSPNVSTTSAASNLAAGTYTVTVTDANSCTIQRSFTITQPAVTAVAQNVTVNLDASGNATLNASSVNYGSTGAGTLTYTIQKIAFGLVGENQSLTLTTPNGANFTQIRFASYGTPNDKGNGNYTLGSCNAANSVAAAQNAYVGRSSGSMDALNVGSSNNNPQLGDPCGGTPKSLAVQVGYSANAASLPYSCTEAGKTQYVLLTVTDGNGSTSTQVARVTVTPPPTASFTLNPTSGNIGAPITASGSNLSGATGLTVNGASATISNLTSTGFTFTVPAGASVGTGTVVLTTPCSQTPSAAFTVTQLATAAPVITAPLNNSLTNSSVTISGTAPAGSEVEVYVSQNSGAYADLGTFTATAGGTFSTPAFPFPSATYQTYATAQSPGASVSANSATITFTVDQDRPSVTITSTAGASGGTSSTTPIPFTVTFSEPVTGFVGGDVSVSNGTITGNVVNGSGTTYTFTVTPTAPGVVTVNVPANVAQDAAGNGNTAAPAAYTLASRPSVAISSTAGASGSTTSTSPIPFTVTFSQNVTGFVAGDVSVSNGTITGGIGNGNIPSSVFTFTVTPTAPGVVTVNVPANVAQDADGNGNTAAPAAYTLTYSPSVAPTLTAVTPTPGGLGQAITLTGTNLSSPTALTINGANALGTILSNSGTSLVVRVPLTAASAGTVSITTAAGTATLPFTLLAPPGNALAFDGVDDYLALPNTTPVPAGNSTYTLEAWIKPTKMDVEGIIGWGNWGTSNQVNALRLSPTGIINYWWGPDLSVTTPDLSGRWHHVAATFDGTTRTIYLDGVALGSDTPGAHTVPTPSNLRIGCTNGPSSGAAYEYFNGSIDEVRVYSVALTAAQLRADITSTTAAVPASLVLYYNFDQGTPATTTTGDNGPYTTLYDLSPNATPATLNNFALASGNTSSNYVQSYALVVPTATAPTTQTSTSFIATWTPPAYGTVSSYLLDVCTTPDFAAPVTGSPFSAAASATSYGVTGLTPNTTYYYRVRALNSALSPADQGAFSNTRFVATPLPVELVSFTATAEGRSAVRLAWATASEVNSARFEVERSLDGTSFQRVSAVAAAGTTTSAHSYALRDASLPSGVSQLYYRLRQVDQDGAAHYSLVRPVTLAGATAGLSLYPNPVHGGAATLLGAVPGTQAKVLDAVGRVVFSAPVDVTGTATLVLPPGLASGVYVVRTGAQALRLTVE